MRMDGESVSSFPISKQMLLQGRRRAVIDRRVANYGCVS